VIPALVLVLAVLAGLAFAANNPHLRLPGLNSSGATATASASPDPEARLAKSLDALVTLSGQYRANVAKAAQGLLDCGTAANDAAKAFGDAAAGRRNLSTEAQHLLTGTQPTDPAWSGTVTAFVTFQEDSAKADDAYQNWAKTEAAEGCAPNSQQDPNFVKASKLSATATTDKQAFLKLWNPLATKFGLATRTDGMI
jgi:hypothetical protein